MQKYQFLYLLLLIHIGVSAQNNVLKAPLLSPEQLKEDFLVLTSTLETQHPSAYRFVSRDSMQRSASAILAQLNEPLTGDAFHLIVRRFITQVHCGHTVAMPSIEWYRQQKLHANILPILPLVDGNQLFMSTAIISDSLAAGKEILSINGRDALEILTDMRAIHTRDGFSGTAIDYNIGDLFQTYFLFLYGSEPEYKVIYRDGNASTTAILKNKEDITGKFPARHGFENYRVAVSTKWSKLYVNTADSLAILRIIGFDRKHYKRYYKQVFREVKALQIPNLVIDVRDNGGGYFPNGSSLLTYLSKDEPVTFRFSRTRAKQQKSPYLKMQFINRMTRSLFKLLPDPVDHDSLRTYEIRYKTKTKRHFDGQLYLLINGGSFSMSGYVSAYLKHHTNAIVIGQETGGGEEGSNAILFQTLTLPNSTVRIHLPYYHLDHQLNGIATDRGIMPDIVVEYRVEDHLEGVDLELEKVLQDLRQRNIAK